MNSSSLCGLVLAGGRSVRMGTDKALLEVHGQTQLTWSAQLLARFCQPVMASVHAQQLSTLTDSGLQLIPDGLLDHGPLAGILAGLQQMPEHGCLVVACDMPWLTASTLAQLVKLRDCTKAATLFTTSTGLEPLCAIWEPAALRPISYALQTAQLSPRKLLEQLPIRRVPAPDEQSLRSINTPELLLQARRDFS